MMDYNSISEGRLTPKGEMTVCGSSDQVSLCVDINRVYYRVFRKKGLDKKINFDRAIVLTQYF